MRDRYGRFRKKTTPQTVAKDTTVFLDKVVHTKAEFSWGIIIFLIAFMLASSYLIPNEMLAGYVQTDDLGIYATQLDLENSTTISTVVVAGNGGTYYSDNITLNITANTFSVNGTLVNNWNTSFLWGDHSVQNYLDLDTYPNADTDSTNDFSGSYNDLINKPTNFDEDDLSDNDTDDLSEGSTNFWTTLARIQSLLSNDFHNIGGIDADTFYEYNQDLNTTNDVTFATINTGEGANDLYDMDQNVLTTDDVTFNNVTVNDNMTIANGANSWIMYINGNGTLVWEMV